MPPPTEEVTLLEHLPYLAGEDDINLPFSHYNQSFPGVELLEFKVLSFTVDSKPLLSDA